MQGISSQQLYLRCHIFDNLLLMYILVVKSFYKFPCIVNLLDNLVHNEKIFFHSMKYKYINLSINRNISKLL